MNDEVIHANAVVNGNKCQYIITHVSTVREKKDFLIHHEKKGVTRWFHILSIVSEDHH